MAEGLCRRLSPEENMWALAHPQIERWALQNLGPGVRLNDAMADTVAVLSRLPRMIGRAELVLEKIENGEFPNMGYTQRAGKAGRFSGIHAAFGLIAALLVALLILELL